MSSVRIFILGLLLLPVVSSLASGSDEAAKPNIVIFLVDDMGPMDTSVPMLTDESGKPRRHPLNAWYRTPNMERLAAQGVRFSNFYAHTVCSPSRVSIMTGQNSARHHTTDFIDAYFNNGGPLKPSQWNWEGLDSGDVILASILRQNGFKTIHIGKAHFAPFRHEGADPRDLGFDVNIGGSPIGRPASYYGQKGYGEGTEVAVPHLDKYHGTATYLTEALTIEAKAELDKVIVEGKPFFLYMSHYAVHGPFDSDPRFATNYKDVDRNERALAFATMIEGMDKSLGDLMDHLETRGVAENTLVLFLGDNGSDAPLGAHNSIASSAPLRGRKGSRWEGGIRVPFVAAWAKPNPKNKWQNQLPIVAGSVRQEIGNCSDLFPTITQLIAAAVPADHPVDGQNLAKLLAGQPDPDHRDEFLSHYPHRRGVGPGNDYFTLYRRGNWKAVYHHVGRKERYELYDLESDPTESNNLAADNPDKLKSMLKAMARELKAKGAQYPQRNGQPIKFVMP
ncbi:MAG: sulfatase [Fuerstiella sp.]|nr:sulfatase [Fuerstiella sp.]MCP4855786.1 sulfatase [Fuerstiella sp.]